MSTNTPNKLGGQQTKGKTATTEARVSDANADLPYDSANHEVVASITPTTLQFSPATSQTEVKHGVNATTAERHMSERSSGFQYSVNETTRLVKQLQNMSSTNKPYFVQATAGWSQATILVGSTASNVSLSSVSGLTTNDLVYAKWNAGTLYEREEERLVKTISGDTAVLQRPFSAAPESATLLKRAKDTILVEGGSDYKEYAHNMKMTGDDASVHILHHKSAVVQQGAKIPGTNAQVMGSTLTFAVNSYEYTDPVSSEVVPAFSEEHDIPRNIALGINS